MPASQENEAGSGYDQCSRREKVVAFLTRCLTIPDDDASFFIVMMLIGGIVFTVLISIVFDLFWEPLPNPLRLS